jgi:hypothetical protein
LSRDYRGAPIALRFLQTSQNQFPLVNKRINHDIPSHAILHRGEFPGRDRPE